jgi:hypothetical protein
MRGANITVSHRPQYTYQYLHLFAQEKEQDHGQSIFREQRLTAENRNQKPTQYRVREINGLQG